MKTIDQIRFPKKELLKFGTFRSLGTFGTLEL